MELSSSFEVARSLEDAWAVLTDVERIAPCLPGAKLQETEGEEHRGVVKIKVGPITAEYKGVATFIERDDSSHRAVLEAKGRDTRGAGNASAVITAQLTAVDDHTTSVSVNTDLTISGKVAQFGRGVMADVSAKLMGQFADNLAAMLEEDSADDAGGASAEGGDSAGTAAAPTGSSGSAGDGSSGSSGDGSGAGSDDDDVEAVDLVSMAGGAVLKRLVPAVIVLVVAIVILVWVLA